MRNETPGSEPGLPQDAEPAPNVPEGRDDLGWHATDPTTGEGFPPEVELLAEMAELERESA